MNFQREIAQVERQLKTVGTQVAEARIEHVSAD